MKDWKHWALFLFWLIILLISIKAHTPWRDEYQSWLISTRAPDARSFFESIRYERHPPLLYLIQRGLTEAFPVMLEWPAKMAIQSVTVPFTVASAFLLIFLLNFPLLQSALLVFSPYLLREFGVISRCYSLGVFFLLAAAAFGQRKRFPPAYAMLALGSLTHLLFTWVCGAIYVLLALADRRKWRDPNFWLTGIILLGSGLLQWPPADGVFQSLPSFDVKTLFVALRGLNQALWGLEKIWQPYEWNTLPAATDVMLVFLFASLFLIRRRLDLRRFLWVSFPPVLLVAAGGGLNLRSMGVAFFGFVATYALFKKENAPYKLDPLTVFSFVAVFSTSLWWLGWAPFEPRPKFNFSGAAHLASTGVATDGILLVADDTGWFSWMAEAKRTVFDMRRNRILAYPYFKNSEYKFEGADAWCEANLKNFRSQNTSLPVYFGQRAGEALPTKCGSFEKIYASEGRILTDERLEIYRML